MRAKLIRKIPAGKDRHGNQLPYYFTRYELECIDCGAHYFNGSFDRRTNPYCSNCRARYNKEKQKEGSKRHQQKLINNVLAEIKTEIDERYEVVKKDNLYVAEGLSMAWDIIDKHTSGKENE